MKAKPKKKPRRVVLGVGRIRALENVVQEMLEAERTREAIPMGWVRRAKAALGEAK